MKESYDEGIASHIGPESCAVVRKDKGEALTGVRAGRVWNREILLKFREPTWWDRAEGHSGHIVSARGVRSLRGRRPRARTEIPRLAGHGNREIPWLPSPTRERRPRREVRGRKPMMIGQGKSDNSTVPRKSSNKARQRATERMEGKELAKGKTLEQNMLRTQGRGGMTSALERIRKADCYSLALSL